MKLKPLTHRALPDTICRVCLFLMLTGAVFSGASLIAADTSFLQMLFVPPDPVSLSLGGANASVACPGSFLINPSHAAGITRPVISAGTVLWWEDITLRSVMAYLPVSAAFTAGIYSFVSDYGNIDAYDAMNTPMGSIDAGDSFFAIGAGYRAEAFSSGVSFARLSQRLSAADEGRAAALLFGAQYRLRFLNTGLSYFLPLGDMDFGSGATAQEIPSIVRAGANCRFIGIRLSAASTFPSAGGMFQSFGAEIPVGKALNFRAGMNTIDSVMGFSAGLGLSLDRFSFDYAFGSAEFGDAVHSFSFSAKLGYSILKTRLYREAVSFFNRGFYEKSQQKLGEVLILDPEYTKAKILTAKIAEIISRLENPSTKE